LIPRIRADGNISEVFPFAECRTVLQDIETALLGIDSEGPIRFRPGDYSLSVPRHGTLRSTP